MTVLPGNVVRAAKACEVNRHMRVGSSPFANGVQPLTARPG